jgi:hypothetical protein
VILPRYSSVMLTAWLLMTMLENDCLDYCVMRKFTNSSNLILAKFWQVHSGVTNMLMVGLIFRSHPYIGHREYYGTALHDNRYLLIQSVIYNTWYGTGVFRYICTCISVHIQFLTSARVTLTLTFTSSRYPHWSLVKPMAVIHSTLASASFLTYSDRSCKHTN